MANGGTTPAGGLNYQGYLDKIRQTAASTRDIGKTDLPSELGAATGQMPGVYGTLGKAAVSNYEKQVASTRKEAERAATGLEIAGETTIQSMQELEALKGQVTSRAEEARKAWEAAPEKADEYVQAARGRVGEVLSKLDEINSQIGKDRDFSKAHAMQASVQATLGAMKTEERNIMETYGAESKEYQQFTESKRTSLASVQSNIHANYAQLAERQGDTFLKATSDAMVKSNMYVGFQEQQHVEMLKYKADAKNAYDLQVSQFEVSIEQMKMSGMENLANWIIETPTFSMDATPLISLLADLQSTAAAEANATKLALAQAQATRRGSGGGGGGGGIPYRARQKFGWT